MRMYVTALVVSAAVVSSACAHDHGISGGSVGFSLDLPTLYAQTPLDHLDAVFGVTETRDELLSLPGDTPGSVFGWDLNVGAVSSPAGRELQGTDLIVNTHDVLGSWGSATSDVGAFVSGGSQIGFGGVTRFDLDEGISGQLLFGDWALLYSDTRAGTQAGATDNTRSGLVLTSNLDFAGAAFADIGNAMVSVENGTLSITGDLLISDALVVLGFPSSSLGMDIGDFSLSATLTPAPGSLAMMACAGGLLSRRRRAC